jgi:hypothetical protein
MTNSHQIKIMRTLNALERLDRRNVRESDHGMLMGQ